MEQRLEDRSVGELVSQLFSDISRLLQQEAALFKAEMAEKGRQYGAGAGMFGGAGAATLLALGSLTACLIIALSYVMPAAVAALILAVVWAVAALILFLRGRAKLQEAAPPVPEQTVESVKEDVRWVKHPTQSGAR